MPTEYKNEPTYQECLNAHLDGRKIQWWNCTNQRWEDVDFDFLFPTRPPGAYRPQATQAGVRVMLHQLMQIDWSQAYDRVTATGDRITGIGRDGSGIWYETSKYAGMQKISLQRGQTTITVRV